MSLDKRFGLGVSRSAVRVLNVLASGSDIPGTRIQLSLQQEMSGVVLTPGVRAELVEAKLVSSVS